MSTLSSSSSLQDVLDAYLDNASYAEDGSATKARAFVTACRCLLLQLPSRAAHGGRGGEEIEIDVGLVNKQIQEAKQWLAVNGEGTASGRTKFADFRGFRD